MMLVITPMSPGKTYKHWYNGGEKAKCLRSISFDDGTRHVKDEIYEVTKETSAYFTCMSKYYEVVAQITPPNGDAEPCGD